jgi:hypothetical protein
LSSERAERLALALESRLAGSADGEVLIDTEHQRMLAITINPMAEGGGVLLFEDVTDRQIAEAKIHQLARFDTLTGLPNRLSCTIKPKARSPPSSGAARSPRCSWTSTTSSRSTTPWATPVVTPCSAR